MLDIGWPELFVVVVVLIVIVGPKSAMEMARDFSGVIKKLKRTAGEFRTQFDDAIKEADLGEVKDLVNDVRDLNPNTHLKSALDPLNKMGNEVKHDFNKIMADAEPSEAAKSVAKKPDTTPETKTEAPAKPVADKPKATKQSAKKAPAKKPATAKATTRKTTTRKAPAKKATPKKDTAKPVKKPASDAS